MNKHDLIKQLLSSPGEEVCIFDIRKNIHHADDIPQSNGIERDFKVEYEEDGIPPFISLTFQNDDYNEDGTKAEE